MRAPTPSTPAAAGVARSSGGPGEAPPTVLRGAKSQAVGLDWLRFSGPRARVALVQSLLTDLLGDGEPGRGGNFLGSSVRWGGGAAVFFDVGEEAANHCVVEVPGGVIGVIGQDAARLLVVRLYEAGFKCTRADVAVDWRGDDVGDLIDQVQASCAGGELCCARRWECNTGYSGTGVAGRVVRIGRRGKQGSGRYVRLYDKGLEQQEESEGRWIRWEAEFADSCAQQVGMAVAESEGRSFARVLLSLALGAVEFRTVTGSRERKRRPMCSWWQSILGAIDAVVVRAKRRSSDLTSWCRWVSRCVTPTIRTLARALAVREAEVLAFAGDVQVGPEDLKRWVCREVLAENEVDWSLACRRLGAVHA